MIKKQTIKVGTKFISGSKRKSKTVSTVVDFVQVIGLKGEIYKSYYICEHEFMGQTVRTEEVDTTIKMGLV